MPADERGKQEVAYHTSSLASATDREMVRSLFESNGYPRSTEEVDWIYRPSGSWFPHATFAAKDPAVAGLYAAVPVEATVDGVAVRAAQSLDTMVDGAFRGMGLFTKLASRTYENMGRDGVGFVFGFPNGNSHHGFVKKLGWLSLDPVPFLFRPLNFGYLIGRALPFLAGRLRIPVPVLGRRGVSEVAGSLPAEEELDQLWSKVKPSIRVARQRHGRYLHERFARKPSASYRFRVVRQSGVLVGLAVYCVSDKHGGRIGYLMELLVDPACGSLASGMLRDVLGDMMKERCDGCLAWCFAHSVNYSSHIRAGFLPLPEWVRPQELHFGVRQLSDFQGAAAVVDRKSWFVSYSDSDTV